MSATYTADFADPLQVVRHLIGDVDVAAPLLTDLEIAYELGAAGNQARYAAVNCCRRLMARFAAVADTTELDLSVTASQLFDHFKALMAELSRTIGNGVPSAVAPYAGGLSRVDVGSRDLDADRVPPLFDRDIPGGRTAPFIGKWPEGWR